MLTKIQTKLDDRLLTRTEVAEIFQVAPSTITRWAESGKLPAIKTLGGQRRYAAKVVLELVQQLTQEEPTMQKTVISVPAMYGDHHVLEVRHILFEMPGVAEVKASSCFQTVEVTFEPTRLNPAQIKSRLAEAGYLDALPVAAESGRSDSPLVQGGQDGFLRHTATYTPSKQVVSFAQNVHPADRPLWPCPGFGLITAKEINHD